MLVPVPTTNLWVFCVAWPPHVRQVTTLTPAPRGNPTLVCMGKPLRVLMVEDSEDDARLVLRELRTAGYDLTHERVDTAAALEAALDRHPWDLVIGPAQHAAFQRHCGPGDAAGAGPRRPLHLRVRHDHRRARRGRHESGRTRLRHEGAVQA